MCTLYRVYGSGYTLFSSPFNSELLWDFLQFLELFKLYFLLFLSAYYKESNKRHLLILHLTFQRAF